MCIVCKSGINEEKEKDFFFHAHRYSSDLSSMIIIFSYQPTFHPYNITHLHCVLWIYFIFRISCAGALYASCVSTYWYRSYRLHVPFIPFECLTQWRMSEKLINYNVYKKSCNEIGVNAFTWINLWIEYCYALRIIKMQRHCNIMFDKLLHFYTFLSF